MRILFSSILVAAIFLLGSCRKSGINRQESIPLHSCEQVGDAGAVTICFNSILEDSRCPINANCVWQGVALVQLRIKANGVEKDFRLATLNMPPHYRTDTTILGYQVKLLNVLPYPGSGSQSPEVLVQVRQ